METLADVRKDLIREHHKTKTYKELCVLTGLSYGRVIQIVKDLGLTGVPQSGKSESQLKADKVREIIRANYMDYTQQELAVMAGVTRLTVLKHMKKMGLKRL